MLFLPGGRVLLLIVHSCCVVTLPLLTLSSSETHAAETIDLSPAAVSVRADAGAIVKTAQRMLTEEIAGRTGITLPNGTLLADGPQPVIVLFPIAETPESLTDFVTEMGVPERPEGFAIAVRRSGRSPGIVLAGRDERGVLCAVGRLLLDLKMTPQKIELPADYRIATAPRYPHRGHQISWRSLAHSYDAWTADTFEQYMRELAVFGANAFETTTFSTKQLDGPHAKLTGGEMATEWARICADYGYDYWLFSSAMGGEGRSTEDEQAAADHLLTLLREIPHLDHIYLTGGDGGSGHRRPDLMFEATGRFAAEARKLHPELGVWVSNQGFGPELNNTFFDYLERERPEWVTGVVYGPWSRILLDEQRARLPEQYPIRRYADIGHCVRSQYPVAGWDRAFAQTLGREPFAPRPQWHARIHNLFDEYADGFVTYSDGIGDDVNKFVWTALGWDPDRALDDILLDYSRFFFGWEIGEPVRQGLLMLEDNFSGSLAENDAVARTFAHWKALEDGADDRLLANWRFQGCLLRACYDHYTRQRLLQANAIEARAMQALREAPEVGVESAITSARGILAEPDQNEETCRLKARIVELGRQMFESIGAQLDVANYKAKNPERGAVLDFLDTPLNNKLWIEDELDAILTGRFTATMPEKTTATDDVRLARLARIVDWENPGPGGFYDDLGCAWKQPHLVKPRPLWDDPAGVTTPREGHTLTPPTSTDRLSWVDQSEALNETPLVLRYDNLEPDAAYRVRVTYLGRYGATIRLVADEEYEIHGAYGHTRKGVRYTAGYNDAAAKIVADEDGSLPPVTPLEFVIPRAATQDGSLELTWQRMTGRGIQVAEVWLIRASAP